MKKFTILAFLLISCFCFAQKKSVLFIGNSYTYYNNGVDAMLKNLALSLGDTVEVEALTSGGASFNIWVNNSQTYQKLAARNWDYVVLQEQSQTPAFPPEQVEWQCYPYAKQLCDSIRSINPCSQILFFMTWGHKNGDERNCQFYEPLCTYDGMQQRLIDSYTEMAFNNEAAVVPVGVAWKYLRDNYQDIELYVSDNSHPTAEGTYLAACCFYSAIFRKSPQGATYSYGLNTNNVAVIQDVANNIVLNDIQQWNLNEQLYLELELTNDSILQVSTNTTWDSITYQLGDTLLQTCRQENFSGQFCISNIFDNQSDTTIIATITLYRGCESECKTAEIQLSPATTTKITDYKDDALSFQNPIVEGKIRFATNVYGEYKILSAEGRTIKVGKINNNEIDVTNLKSGVYLLLVGQKTSKFVIY